MITGKPFSQACENNKEPILQVIKNVYNCPLTVWEIGSGTGQHACYFAQKMSHLIWQPTDKQENLAGISRWVQASKLANLNPPLALDVNETPWPCLSIAALFSANTLHIMSWQEVIIFFTRLGEVLATNAVVCFYGPFNYLGNYTSASNAQFDQNLKARDPLSGIRDVEAVVFLALTVGIQLSEDHAMPANNRLLVMRKA
jgi:Protein of unknown function (DUF938)